MDSRQLAHDLTHGFTNEIPDEAWGPESYEDSPQPEPAPMATDGEDDGPPECMCRHPKAGTNAHNHEACCPMYDPEYDPT